MKSDFELLEDWRRGDREAGNQLFRRHFAMVHRFFANKADSDCEDLVQRTFEICVAGKDQFEGRGSFPAYLLGIARNLLRKHWDSRRTRNRTDDIEELALHDIAPGPSTVAARSDDERRLLEALRRLPLKFQLVLELYFWEELTGAEVGQILGVGEDTARSRLRRAKHRLGAEVAALERSHERLQSTSDDLMRWAASIRAQALPR